MKRVLLALIRFYQKYISPMKRGGACNAKRSCRILNNHSLHKYHRTVNTKPEGATWMPSAET